MIETVTEGPASPGRFVSVVIPAFNEGPHVAAQVREVHRILAETGWTFEIIVVDDGSSDETAAEASAAGARVLRRRQNRGYGAAIKLGVERASHDFILITDADGTYPTSAIPQLLGRAEENAMVVGVRTGASVQVPLLRRPAKAFLRWLASYLCGERIPDLNSGLRVMRRDLIARYAHLLPNGFSLTTTITMASICNNHAVEYVPIDYYARLGSSKIRPWHAYEFTLLVLRVIVYFNPLKVFIPAGALIALAGLGKLGLDMVRGNLSESAVLALLGALIMWAVGLLADQNAQIAVRR